MSSFQPPLHIGCQMKPRKNMHEIIAPEVRNKQSFASVIYSTGRVIHKINSAVLQIPGVRSLSELCLSEDLKKRPTSSELHSSFKFLFNL